ncbi:unnamed protein product [Adineta steineri]|uniref:Uncharacterized protein n=1 Tax=Adineta steineri TaxID=433720 RepID=A0A814QEZ9_9BILA|nr:unnamed protein product [Adineta steineri]
MFARLACTRTSKVTVWYQRDQNVPTKIKINSDSDIDDLKEAIFGATNKGQYQATYKAKILKPSASVPWNTTDDMPIVFTKIGNIPPLPDSSRSNRPIIRTVARPMNPITTNQNLVLLLIIIEGTVESKRSSRIVLIVSITTGVGAGASSGIGYYIAWRGFIDLFWAALISQLLSIIITIRYIKPSHFKSETRERSESTTSLLTKSHDGPKTSPLTWAHVFQIVTVFAFKRRSKKKSICIYLTMISYAFNVFIGSSSAAFLWYLLNVPFCWSSFEIGNYIAVFAITSAVFTLVSMRMLTHIGVSDPFICAIGYICLFTSTIWIALAEHKWEMYVALIIGSFSTYQNSLTWTMLSKWLEPHERSKAFTFFTDLSALMTTLGSSFFNWLYARTVVYYRGTTLIFAASLAIIPFILNICLLLVTRYMTDDRFGRLSISEIDIETTSSDLLTDVLPETDSDMIDLSDSSPPLLIEFINQSCIN